MGISANLCPPEDHISNLDGVEHEIFLSAAQPPSMAGWQLAARLAVLLQCLTVYPVLLYVIRAQAFTALYFHRPHPNWWAVLLMNVLLASITLTVVILQIGLSDVNGQESNPGPPICGEARPAVSFPTQVLRFAGAFASLICVYGVPGCTHWRVSRLRGQLTWSRAVVCVLMILLGLMTMVVQFLPPNPR